jgi:hypothetical protein
MCLVSGTAIHGTLVSGIRERPNTLLQEPSASGFQARTKVESAVAKIPGYLPLLAKRSLKMKDERLR